MRRASGAHRPAVGLACRAALRPGQEVRQSPVIPQAHACRDRVEQRNAPAWSVRTLRRPVRSASPAIVGTRVGTAGRGCGGIAQRRHQQYGHTGQREDVNPGDYQHQLSIARHGCKGSGSGRSGKAFFLPLATIVALMTTSQATELSVGAREPGGSREARRLRREGKVPGVVYGGGEDPVSFSVDARTLRQALAHAGAVLNLSVEGAGETPVVVKEISRHPVNGETVHIDLLRVRLDQAIQATVVLELVGAEDAPGVKEGGVLEHVTRELRIEALPNDIPDTIPFDVSAMQIGDTITLESVSPPANVSLIDDPETVIATLTPPRLQTEDETEIEQEVELVAEGATSDEAEQAAEEQSGGEAESSGE